MTECNGKPIVFQSHGRREVTAGYDGGRLSSDVDALGYEDLRDQDQLRDDSDLALAVGCGDITGADQVRERERGHPLASSSTLNRLVLGTPDKAAEDRCKRISADPAAIDRLPVALSLEAHGTAPEEIVLDLGATDDPLLGAQEGRHFHAHEESTACRKFRSLAAIGDMCKGPPFGWRQSSLACRAGNPSMPCTVARSMSAAIQVAGFAGKARHARGSRTWARSRLRGRQVLASGPVLPS